MKRVAIVYHYFAHYRAPVLKALDEDISKKFNLYLLSDDNSNLEKLNVVNFQQLPNKNTTIVSLKNIWIGRFLYQKGLGKRLKQVDPDIVVFLAQFNFISTWFYSMLYRLKGKDVIFWGHGMYGNETGLKKIVRKLFNYIPQHFMTYGEYARRLMIRDGINADAITVIYNSLDVHEQNLHYELLNKEGVSSSDGAFRIVFVGRITPQKRLDLLVTAVLSLLDKGYNIQVDIVGDGFYLKSLKILTQRFEDKFHFHGSQHTEVYLSKLLYCANVCISPGNVGLTAMHSLVYGTPVITHNRKSQQMPEFEIIRDGFNGSLFEYDDIGSLEEKIIFWYELLRSREDIRSDCRSALLRYYTPWNQSRIILDVLKRYD